ncbi:MAG: YebC/PmpR family DNA-binding transcriptional regulator [Bacteroidota bacterium]|jgi:YebC/PmpR family DNA-binding regulatory protein|nr:YebC/PmpR family DNA-binding transcriptional regulator [Bacteroidota bacterium]GDX47876.1 putative transcriptional regulatory protein [Bacteroidota bacterium]
MGRIFEKRKHKIFARMDKMAKAFTKIGKEIAMAVKQGGTDPNNNPRLRVAMQNAKGVNMPKDRVEAAIKRATSKEEKDLSEATYEGYGPHGIAIMVDCATDNPTRTVANLRMYFDRSGGALGKSGSVEFMFDRKGVFKLDKQIVKLDEVELDLIDLGAEEIQEAEDGIMVYTSFQDFGNMQKGLEEKGFAVISSEVQRIPTTTKELSDEQVDDVLKLIEKLEEDDDVQNVFHNLA